MELLADSPVAITLAVLALLDGLSVGTLLIPVFLLLSPGRVRAGRILLYLASITVFYLVVGLLFLWGLVNLVDVAAEFLASQAGLSLRLLVGGGMLVGSFFIPGSKGREVAAPVRSESARVSSMEAGAGAAALTPPPPTAAPDAPTPRPGRLTRWRDRLLDPATPPVVVIGVAIAAGLVEVATMLPYIVAMTMLADADYGAPLRISALVGYCLLMIAPALLLLVLRVAAARHVEKPLQRIADWLARNGAESTAWIVGIIGFLIARGAASELGLFAFLDRLT
ncbi:MAG: GAP family protein [Microbacterium sp.]|jgi:hypothetical protein|nr:GAP family protein [Microbacterium sp.]